LSSEYKVKAIAAGCDEYLQKPLDVAEFKTQISAYFSNDDGPGMPVEKYQKLCQRFVGSLPEKQDKLRHNALDLRAKITTTIALLVRYVG
jgi:DNA-binding response OmpR family regulator